MPAAKIPVTLAATPGTPTCGTALRTVNTTDNKVIILLAPFPPNPVGAHARNAVETSHRKTKLKNTGTISPST